MSPLRGLIVSHARTLRAIIITVALLACGDSSNPTGPGGGSGGVSAVGSVAISPTAPTVTIGGQLALQAQVKTANGNAISGATVFWSSADTNTVTISSGGIVTGKTVGTAEIAASSGGVSARVVVTVVSAPVTSIVVAPTAATLVVGGTTVLQAVTSGADGIVLTGRTIVWASSAPQVAAIDATGNVIARSAGTTSITATSEGKTATSTITVTVIPVASISIAPTSASLLVGASTSLTAIPADANGNVLGGRPITWQSADSTIASVSDHGLVTAVGPGTVSITATAEGKTSTAQIVVTSATPTPVGSVAVSPANASIVIGGNATFSATVRDANGTILNGRDVAWASSDPAIATVSSSGVASAVAVGSTTITATSEGKSGTASVAVSAVPVSSVTVNPTTASLNVGATTTLTAVTKDAGGNVLVGRPVTWTSGTPGVATVNASGVVSGASAGTATITATSEGKNATSVITVTLSAVASITLNPSSASLVVGSATTIAALLKDASGNVLTGRAVTWTSSTPGVATVDANGAVTAVLAGTATIRATSEGKSASSAITVSLISVASVVLNPASANLLVGGTTTLAATTKDANRNVLTGRVVTWTSTAPAVATVNTATGLITAVAVGTATITATSEGHAASASVAVSAVPVSSVTVNPPTASLNVGATTTITAVAKDAGGGVLTGRTITWTSNAPSIASVSASGLVTGIGAGNATITAASEGKSASSAITVSLSPVASITLNPPSASLVVGSTTTIAAVLKDASNTVLAGRTITWTSNRPGVATVDANGMVTAVSAGTATVTATSEGHSATAAITVSLVSVATVVVSPANASLYVGATTTLSAITKDANGNVLSGRVVAWASSAPTVATVNAATGLITAVAPGTTTIAATSEGHAGNASVVVSVVPVSSVTVSPTTASLNVGATTTLTTVTKDAGGGVLTGRTITWTSTAPSIASVSATGVVSGASAGTATITATSEGRSATSVITVTLTPVTSITLTPSTASLVVGSAATITATLKDANGSVLTGRSVAWVSSTPGVATVDVNGVVTAASAGTATVTATSEGHSASAAITVSLVSVASVVLNPTSANLFVDSTATLSAITKDAAGNVLMGRVVTWTSSAPAIATVNPTTGLVTAVAAGVTTITGTSEGHHADASVVVTLVPVASVTIDQSPLTMETDSSVTLTATVRDANGHILTGRSVAWQIDNTTVATIGVTTGVLTTTGTTGTATITATSGGRSGTASLTVGTAPVGSVVLSPSSVALQVPATTTVAATVKDSHNRIVTGRTINWTSSDPAVASVNGSGVITALAPGSSTVTATSEGKSGTTAVSVTDPVAAVVVTAPTTSVAMYGTLQLTDTTKNGSGAVLRGRTVTWTSSTPGVATVNRNGRVTGVSAGTSAITAMSEGVTSNSIAITVTEAPVATVSVAPSTPSVQVGATAQFTATTKDSHGVVATGSTITWASDNPAVATVNAATGLATAVAPGAANITATSSDGPSGSASLTVTAAPVASVTVTPTSASLSVGATTTITAVTKDAGGNVLSGRAVTWTSSTPSVATVSASGVVTGASAGSSTIAATSEGQSATSAITVTAVPVASVTLSPTSANLYVDSTTTLSVVTKDANGNVLTGRVVAWTSSAPTVATVDAATGLVTAIASGPATITATSEGQSADASVVVALVPVASVAVSPTSLALTVNQTDNTLVATPEDVNNNPLSGRTITWSSSAPSVATVDPNTGVVTAVAAGTATITATCETVQGITTVTVTP